MEITRLQQDGRRPMTKPRALSVLINLSLIGLLLLTINLHKNIPPIGGDKTSVDDGNMELLLDSSVDYGSYTYIGE